MTNATRVSKSAGLTLGITITSLFLLTTLRSARAGEVVITITGTFRSGTDYGAFGTHGKALTHVPFTLIYRFDDTKGDRQLPSCPNTGSGIYGSGPKSPGTATLTVNGISHEFGKGMDLSSSAWRTIASGCSKSDMRFNISAGPDNSRTIVGVMLQPEHGSLTQNPDWRAPMFSKDLAWAGFSGFVINGGPGHSAEGDFSFDSVTIK